ncbi:MAG: alpha/beta hydrolase [Anaerolineae bacterium]|nr:alpha/beta hydrolase [Anaerolineae bacterium]
MTDTTTPVKAQENSGYAPVNGLEMYYEVYGEGTPLILIHGGLGGIVEFKALIPQLAETRKVIAVELQGHGHTADIDRPLTYEAMADDIAALIAYLGYDEADVLGYSMGGGVALQTAIRHPDSVNRLVLVSTPFARSGIHPEFLAGMEAMNAASAEMMLETPMYQFYSAVAPRPEDWDTLVGKVGDLLRTDYDWSEDVASLTIPTLIIAGDADMIPPQHAVAMFSLLGGGVPGDFVEKPASQLAILPDTTHFNILSKLDVSVIADYLAAQ